MRILLLGGSNTGLWQGWAHHFVILAQQQFGAHVINGFLGAVGSLFGLFRLLKLEREGAELPDVIVFEYTLNDIILRNHSEISDIFVRDTLMEIADFCVRRSVRLQLLCLEPNGFRKFWNIRSRRSIQRIYADVAREYALPKPLFQTDVVGRPPRPSDYLDRDHLTPECSRLVAEALLGRLSDLPKQDLRSGMPRRPRSFEFVDATQATLSGRAEQTFRDMKVLQGAWVEMKRPAKTIWPGTGRLVGIVFRSTPASGWYRLAIGHASRRRNASVSDLSVLPELVAMQYPSIREPARGSIEIALPDDEAGLMRLLHDRSHMEQLPPASFEGQELAINALILWRGPIGFGRVREPVNFWWRLVLRGMVRNAFGVQRRFF